MLDKQLIILVDEPLLDAIRLAALNDRRSIGAWVRVQIENALTATQLRHAQNLKTDKEVANGK